MSLSDSERLISTSLPISELIKHIKHSFLERDFNEVQNILMDRENGMKMEIENLIRDRDSAKEEVGLLERTVDLAGLEKSKIEEKLQKNRRICEKLEETITRLLEEKRVSSDREKKAEEWYDKLYTQNSEINNEKNELVVELNEKVNELKNKNLESERLVGVYQERCKCLDTKVVKMGQEIEDLRHERLAATQSVLELRRKQSEVEKVVEELNRQNVEANRTIDELRLKKPESDEAAEFNKSRLENLAPRIMKIEELLADMLNVKVGDLATLVGEMGKLATSEGGNLGFPDFKGKKDNSGNRGTPDDAENMVVMSPGVRSTSNSTGSRSIGLSKSNKGDRNLAQSSTIEDVAHTVETSHGSRSCCDPPQAENNECKERHCSGAHASGTQLMSGEGCFSKIPCSSSAAGDIIEIIDSDDEANPDGAADIPNGGIGSNVGENEMNFEKLVQSPCSSQRSKRNRTDCGEDILENLVTKRTRNMCTSHEDDNNVSIDTQTPLQKFNGLNDEDSTDSDESCSDSTINDLIASLRSNKHHRKWTREADMLQAFWDDEELCMNAVCALYRKQIFAGKSTELSNLSKNEGVSTVDSMSGCALAEYLIDGDQELRLRKSVSDVKQQRPDVISQCRKLANIYVEKLFAIYSASEDPFFGQT